MTKNKIIKLTIIAVLVLFCGTTLVLAKESSSTLSEEDIIKLTAEKHMMEYPNLLKEGFSPFIVKNIKTKDNWAVVNLVSIKTDESKDADAYDFDLYMAIVIKEESSWQAYLETEEGFADAANKAPSDLITERSKQALIDMSTPNIQIDSSPGVTDEYHIPGLPWAIGESWDYNGGPHGTNNSSLDFGTPEGGLYGTDTVKAAEDGTIIAATETCITIERYNSDVQLFYQHINSSDVDNWGLLDEVDLGDTLGDTTISSGCGGSSTGHHIHFAMKDNGSWVDIKANEASFNGWIVQNDSNEDLKKEDSSASHTTDDDVLHEDWVVAVDTLFKGEAHIPRNVKIRDLSESNSTLELGNGAIIDMDFTNYKLEVKNGSSLFINNGGTIK